MHHNDRVCGAGHESEDQPRHCKCQEPGRCPLNRECLTSNIIYKAIVDDGSTSVSKTYIGSTETSFKQWIANHLKSFRHERNENSMELSKYIWKLKHESKTFRINWSTCILRKASAYSSQAKRCDPCLTEKLMILSVDNSALLSKRSDLVSMCRHQNKFSLLNFASAVTKSPANAYNICTCA